MGGDANPHDPTWADEIAAEQSFVDQAYSAVDAWHTYYRTKQAEVAKEFTANYSQVEQRNSLAGHYGDEATRLESVENHLVFGHLDMTSGEGFHIGRIGLRQPPEDGGDIPPSTTARQLLVDWRAKVSSPFYQATAVKPLGVRKRRHIDTSLRKVVSVEDDLLDVAAGAGDNTLQGEGALLAALSKARAGRMHDIVATIQAEQDRVIRADLNAFLVVQGGPGTGKTAVALHRAAYLLYAHRKTLETSGVLIVGPNPVFLRYIERVLPALGETDVVSLTLAECFPGVKTVPEEAKLKELKGSLRWVEVAARAVADLKRPPTSDVQFRVNHVPLSLSVSQVRHAMSAGSHAGSTHNQHWAAFAKNLLKELHTQYARAFPDHDEEEWLDEELRSSPEVRRVVNRMYLPASATQILHRLYAFPAYLKRIASDLFTPAEIESLYRPKEAPFTDSDVPILDELQELLGLPPSRVDHAGESSLSARELERAQEAIDQMELGEGIVNAQMLAELARAERMESPLAERARMDRSWAYGHVVVDEAQELTAMDWHLLLRRCPSRSFTVVGDVNQASQANRGQSWQELLGPAARANPVMETLTINYRTPGKVMALAEAVLRANGSAPLFPSTSAREVPDCLEITRLGAEISEDRLVKITKKILLEEASRLENEVGIGAGKILVVSQLGGGFGAALGLAGSDPIEDQVCYLAPFAAKGLEFDVVVLVDPVSIFEQSLGDLYVAMTRPTRRLRIVCREVLPGLESDV